MHMRKKEFKKIPWQLTRFITTEIERDKTIVAYFLLDFDCLFAKALFYEVALHIVAVVALEHNKAILGSPAACKAALQVLDYLLHVR